MNFKDIINRIGGLQRNGLGAPVLLMIVMAMVVLPLAPFMLDLLFTFNIALSIVILLAVIYVMRPMEFSAFPTVLLVVTVLRLALNVASTRVVLMHGHEGTSAAGHVIEAFGEFVIGGHYSVGFVVFAILTIINFMVVTKGAERVSEVAARFTLDSLPGKQMAIDADMNAGVLSREEATARRNEVREEADFYGSMDGSSKFIRGDAMAGILILFINIIGGLLIGTVEHGLSIDVALKNYTLLTIGDGLVAQLPSLLLSTSVAILVTRMSRSQDMGQQMVTQVFGQPRVLLITGALMVLVGLIPGMPNVAFLALGLGCGGIGWLMHQREGLKKEQAKVDAVSSAPAKPQELSWDDVSPEDALGLEVGYRLIPLVDQRKGGELMSRIKGVRKKLTQELGFLIPAVHIRDNLELQPGAYRITLHGVPLATGQVYPDRDLALNPGRVFGTVEGIPAKDPTFGLDALWIEKSSREFAQTQGYTVVDAGTVIATHISQIIKDNAPELLGHDEAQALLTGLAKSAPKLVEDLVPKTLSLSVFVKVLQGLLAERIPLRNLRGIAEALSEHAPRSQDPGALISVVRVALGRQIVQEINGMEPELPVLTLAPQLERVLQDSLQSGGAVLEPGLAERMHKSLSDSVAQRESAGEPSVLLVPGALRPLLSKFTRQTIPGLHVLAYNEVPESKKIRMLGAVGY